MRRAAKVDDNHKTIVKALRRCGCSVVSLAAVGVGCPDLLVGLAEKNYLLEVKDGNKPPSKRKLTPDQRQFFAEWRGQAIVVIDVDTALEAVGVTGV